MCIRQQPCILYRNYVISLPAYVFNPPLYTWRFFPGPAYLCSLLKEEGMATAPRERRPGQGSDCASRANSPLAEGSQLQGARTALVLYWTVLAWRDDPGGCSGCQLAQQCPINYLDTFLPHQIRQLKTLRFKLQEQQHVHNFGAFTDTVPIYELLCGTQTLSCTYSAAVRLTKPPNPDVKQPPP
jgi:hypothetical protein